MQRSGLASSSSHAATLKIALNSVHAKHVNTDHERWQLGGSVESTIDRRHFDADQSLNRSLRQECGTSENRETLSDYD